MKRGPYFCVYLGSVCLRGWARPLHGPRWGDKDFLAVSVLDGRQVIFLPAKNQSDEPPPMWSLTAAYACTFYAPNSSPAYAPNSSPAHGGKSRWPWSWVKVGGLGGPAFEWWQECGEKVVSFSLNLWVGQILSRLPGGHCALFSTIEVGSIMAK